LPLNDATHVVQGHALILSKGPKIIDLRVRDPRASIPDMRNAFLIILGVFAGTGLLSAQTISIGVKGGIPLNDPTSNTFGTHDESPPYVVGASVEVKLPANFAIEADALYRRIGNTVNFGNIAILTGVNLSTTATNAYINRTRGNSWEFPLLGKYYLREHSLMGWQPFLGTGFAFRTIGFSSTSTQVSVDSTGQSTILSGKGSYRSNLDVGATVAAGVRMRHGRMAIAPEFRYTRWGGADNNQVVRNDARFLLGLSF
jgi:hypothetical protein